jgi:hypothetical protein
MISIILTIIVVGVLLWLANSYIPMDGKIKKILNVVVVVGLILYILVDVGALNYIQSLDSPHGHAGRIGCGFRR